MPKLTNNPGTRLLMSRDNIAGPTLEQVLIDIIHDLNAKTECLVAEQVTINSNIVEGDDDRLELFYLLDNAAKNNTQIISLLREAVDLQLQTIQEFRLYDTKDTKQ